MEFYPLVNVCITNWKDPPFLMEQLTISTGPFSIAMLNYQRVSGCWCVLTILKNDGVRQWEGLHRVCEMENKKC